MSCCDGPPLSRRVYNALVAGVRHGLDLLKHRTQEEIDTNLAICQACPLLQDGVCSHPDCGCPIRGGKRRFWNKLAWRSEECPLGKW